MSSSGPHHLFFTSKDDPREDCIIIGFTYGSSGIEGSPDKPIFFRFTTAKVSDMESKTVITRGTGESVASLDWAMHDQLGMVTYASTKQQPMKYYMMNGSAENARMFVSTQNQRYEWRRISVGVDAYDLYSGPNTRIATFRHEARDTPVGIAHAVMQYIFDDDDVLLDSLIALCLIRWVDLRAT